ncbi:MAG: hypothetical protein KY469_09905 [Actinobacteria bacterium]|nr:hypothetical protein [Actinomycetota bacterium]
MSTSLAPTGREVAIGPPGTGLARRRAVLALARVETWRLVRHPAFLVAPLLIAYGAVGVGTDSPDAMLRTLGAVFLWGFGYMGLGLGAMIAANLVASRDRRDDAVEMLAAHPLDARDRTLAQVLAVTGPAAVALGISAVLAVVVRPWTAAAQLTYELDPQTASLGRALVFLLQGAAIVALLGVVGVLLARWVPTVAGALLAAVGVFMLQAPAVWSDAAARWLAPLATYRDPGAEPAAVMVWHVIYLLALTALAAFLALRRHGSSRRLRGALGIAAACVIAAGTVQLLAVP